MRTTPTETSQSLLQSAENKIFLEESSHLETVSADDARKLVQELQVHQIELEMQNDELRRKQGELESALALYELAPIGYLIFSKKGMVQKANRAATTMVGIGQDDLHKKSMTKIVFYDDITVYDQHCKRLLESGDPQNWEMRMLQADGSPFWASVRATSLHNGNFGITLTDISERKLAEKYQKIGWRVLQILNEPGDLQDSILRVLTTLKTQSGFDAVGIRLQEGDDYPYFVQEGFAKDFLQAENTLAERTVDGGVCRDNDGNVCLQCTCGLVISGKTDPTNPLFTDGGSCWTNNSFPLLDIPPGDDPRLHPRNHCIHQGYSSVALVPIRDDNKVVGLIQFNDRRKGCFTLETVELLESIASYIGVALMRKRTEDQLFVSEVKYHSLFNASADAILITSLDGKNQSANPAACRMFGRTEEEIMQIGRSELVDTSDPRFPLAIEERNNTGSYRNVELRCFRKNGETFPVDVSSFNFKDKGGNARTILIIRDITVRKRLEDALQNNNERLQELVAEKTSQLSNTLAHLASSERFKHTVIDSLPANIAVIDKNGMILSINRPWVQFGKENNISDETCISVGADYLAACRKASSPDEPGFESALSALHGISSVLEGRETSFTMDYPCHSPTINRWYRMTVNWPDVEFEGAIISHNDISALKQLEQEQRTYTSHLVEAIERERTRTARELHDSLGQSLALISFTINELKRDNSYHNKNQQNLLDIQTGVVRMMESIRRICADLRPALLDELGLSAALEWQCKDFTRRSGIPCSFTFNDDSCDNNRECQMTIFRIVQESQNNTIKHAAASRADLSLYRKDDSVCVEFIDDGVGFTTQNSSGDRSFGIIGMRERAKALGATFEIVSNKGKGTSVKLVIPCKRQEETDALSHS